MPTSAAFFCVGGFVAVVHKDNFNKSGFSLVIRSRIRVTPPSNIINDAHLDQAAQTLS